TKEAVRLALDGVAIGVACDGCPPLPELLKRYEAAGGRYYVCPVCFNSKKLNESQLIAGAEVQGTVPMWNWIGDEGATTFRYYAMLGGQHGWSGASRLLRTRRNPYAGQDNGRPRERRGRADRALH